MVRHERLVLLGKLQAAQRRKDIAGALFRQQSRRDYHHWRVFSNGADGVSIQFKKDRLLEGFRRACKYSGREPIAGCVEYVKISELKSNHRCIEDLPFLKWAPYGDEREYRIVYADHRSFDSWGFEIELEWIEHISLSPWLPAVLEDSVRDRLNSIRGCSELCISRSRVTDFAAWKAAADKIVGRTAGGPSTKAESFDPIQLAGAWPGGEPLETLLAQLD